MVELLTIKIIIFCIFVESTLSSFDGFQMLLMNFIHYRLEFKNYAIVYMEIHCEGTLGSALFEPCLLCEVLIVLTYSLYFSLAEEFSLLVKSI